MHTSNPQEKVAMCYQTAEESCVPKLRHGSRQRSLHLQQFLDPIVTTISPFWPLLKFAQVQNLSALCITALCLWIGTNVINAEYTLCLKKVHPFIFLWLLGQLLTDFANIWYCSWDNLQPNDIFFSYNTRFVYEYYRIEKREIFCMLSMLLLHLKFVQSPTLIQKFFTKFFAP